MQSLTQNILYKKHLFFNVYENVLHLMKYLRKFHTILKVKNETLQSWAFLQPADILSVTLHLIYSKQEATRFILYWK
jgi:uncharacterized protein with NAD-binding domain and iron-sulfur cluster